MSDGTRHALQVHGVFVVFVQGCVVVRYFALHLLVRFAVDSGRCDQVVHTALVGMVEGHLDSVPCLCCTWPALAVPGLCRFLRVTQCGIVGGRDSS